MRKKKDSIAKAMLEMINKGYDYELSIVIPADNTGVEDAERLFKLIRASTDYRVTVTYDSCHDCYTITSVRK